jgi:hypothetical protein
MTHSFRSIITVSCAGACLTLAACAASQKTERVGMAPAGFDELTSLYAAATDHHRRAVRKPVRDEHDRMLRLLATRTEAVLAETDQWDTDARLTALAEPQRNEVHQTVQEFQDSLRGLQAAAAKSDIPELRTQYARSQASYRRLNELTRPLD